MFILLIFIYSAILSYPYWSGRKLPIFHPSKIACMFYFFYTVPFLLISSFDKDLVIHQYVSFRYNNEVDSLLLKFVFIQTIGILFLYLGIFTPIKVKRHEIIKESFVIKNNFRFFFTAFLCFMVVACSFFVYLVSTLGGVLEVLNNSYLNANFLSGSGHLVLIINTCAFISVNCLNKALSFRKINTLYLFVIYGVYFVILSSFGGRSNFLLLMMMSFFSYSMFLKTFKIATIKSVFIVAALASYVIIMPFIRDDIFADRDDYITLIIENFAVLAKGNDYINIQLSILGYFDFSNLWLGKSYGDLLYSVIPSSLYPDKPPVAEGVYFFNNVIGNVQTPPYPARNMVLVGWPPGTMGIMFSNFHIFGVIFGYYILGLFYKYTYKKLLASNFSVSIIYLYLYVLLKFELTNHYIFHLTTLLILLRVVVYVQRRYILIRG